MDNEKEKIELLAETESFSAVRTVDEDGAVFHLELGGVSLHFVSEEWEELVLLIKDADRSVRETE